MTVPQALIKLAHSEFRSKFKLSDEDRLSVEERGMLAIRLCAEERIREKLAPAHPIRDGFQTPLNGHPVFKAQHATATCCRNCLHNWWRVRKGIPFSELQQDKIVNLIMAWIEAMMGFGITDSSVNGIAVELPPSAFWTRE